MSQSGEIAQWITFLHEDQSLISRVYVKVPSMVACTCNHIVEEGWGRKRDSRGLLASQSSLMDKFEASERLYLKKGKQSP